MAIGRPTKYTDLLVAKANKYLNVYESTLMEVIPSHAGLASYLGITRSTLYDWGAQRGKKDFSDILARIKNLQELTLINSGLTGDFNANIVKMMLVKHGYHDKQENTLSNPDGSAISNQWHIHPVTNAKEGTDASGNPI